MKSNLETLDVPAKLSPSALLRTKMLWFVAFASFCSIRALPMANFRLPLGCQWPWSWEDTCTTGSWEGASELAAAQHCEYEDNSKTQPHLPPCLPKLSYTALWKNGLDGIAGTYMDSKSAQLSMIVTVQCGEQQRWEWEGISVSP